MKIGIFGGRFDPIHIAHTQIAALALEYVDKVIFVPAGNAPHKGLWASSEDRYNMVKLAISDVPQFEISDFEVKQARISYSVDTIQYFSDMYGSVYFIIGDDAYSGIHLWKDYKRVCASCTFLVFNRVGAASTESIIRINNPPLEISSTKIRSLIVNDVSIAGLVSEKVEDYIIKNGIYNDFKAGGYADP